VIPAQVGIHASLHVCDEVEEQSLTMTRERFRNEKGGPRFRGPPFMLRAERFLDPPRPLVLRDHEDVEVLVETEIVLTGLALHVLGLVHARALGLLLVGATLATPGCYGVLDLRH